MRWPRIDVGSPVWYHLIPPIFAKNGAKMVTRALKAPLPRHGPEACRDTLRILAVLGPCRRSCGGDLFFVGPLLPSLAVVLAAAPKWSWPLDLPNGYRPPLGPSSDAISW